MNIALKALLAIVKADPKLLPWALRQLADYLDKNPGTAETLINQIPT